MGQEGMQVKSFDEMGAAVKKPMMEHERAGMEYLVEVQSGCTLGLGYHSCMLLYTDL